MPEVTGEFEIASWNEDTYDELGGAGKLTRASVTMTFKGGIVGEGATEWLMCYRQDGSARFVGLQRIEGALDGRKGSFVVESTGDFDGAQAEGRWSVVPGSGTEDLAGVSGDGRFQAPLGSKASFSLEYDFDRSS